MNHGDGEFDICEQKKWPICVKIRKHFRRG